MKTVLVIDDKYGFRDYFKILLERMGLKVITADNGEAAIQIIKNSGEIELVVLDLRMKEADGRLLLSRLKGIRPEVKVLVSTVFMDDAVEKELYSIGADAVLKKPFPVPGFRDAVRELLSD